HSSRAHICYQLVNIARIGKPVTTLFSCPNVRHAENLRLPSICLQIPGVGHDGTFSLILLKFNDSEVNISPVLRYGLSQPDRRAGNFRPAAWILIYCLFGQTFSLACLENPLQGIVLIARVLLGHKDHTLYFLHLPGIHRLYRRGPLLNLRIMLHHSLPPSSAFLISPSSITIPTFPELSTTVIHTCISRSSAIF